MPHKNTLLWEVELYIVHSITAMFTV